MSDMALTSERPDTGASSPDQERERIHRQMLSAVAHDLKTPLASIIGSLDVYTQMKDALPADKQDALIKVALQEAHRLDSFITNILDMAKLENGLVISKQEDVEIGAMLRDCLTRMRHCLKDSTIDVESSSGTVKTITDVVLLNRALGLVLDNAVKYGGTPSVIRLKFGKDSSRLGYISIHDNGNGISEERVKDIFSKYIRFDKEGKRNNAGMGLGLAIAREIMALLNGDITAANHPDGGAVLTLHFPLQ
jgi:two-component system sensor histidine kinase KdpD